LPSDHYSGEDYLIEFLTRDYLITENDNEFIELTAALSKQPVHG